jgi:tripartite-type tricarboxylate transporter receptor subunit TctC
MAGILNKMAFAAAAALCMASAGASAATWPTHSIHVTVPYAAGGTVDTVARYLAQELGAELGQPLVVENKPGAGGNIGTMSVTHAQADGYTLLIAGAPTHVLNPYLYKNLGFDPLKDLTQIALIGAAPNLLVVNPSLPAKSVQDLVRLAQRQPGSITFSSSGRGTTGHLAGELLGSKAGIDLRHIPYKGQADAITAVIRGDVSFAFVTIPGTLAQVEAGRLRAIAITSAKRSELAPNVPTVAESGYPSFEVLAWYNLSAPAGLPAAIKTRIVDALTKVMGRPATKARFISLGLEPRLMTGEKYLDFLHGESAKWGAVIKAAGIEKR